jgi:hypothetical protein
MRGRVGDVDDRGRVLVEDAHSRHFRFRSRQVGIIVAQAAAAPAEQVSAAASSRLSRTLGRSAAEFAAGVRWLVKEPQGCGGCGELSPVHEGACRGPLRP